METQTIVQRLIRSVESLIARTACDCYMDNRASCDGVCTHAQATALLLALEGKTIEIKGSQSQMLGHLRTAAEGYVPASFLAHELPNFTHDHLASLAWLADEAHNALQYCYYTDVEAAETAAAHADQIAEWLPFNGERERWRALAETYRDQAKAYVASVKADTGIQQDPAVPDTKDGGRNG